jgi:hypothetical protein
MTEPNLPPPVTNTDCDDSPVFTSYPLDTSPAISLICRQGWLSGRDNATGRTNVTLNLVLTLTELEPVEKTVSVNIQSLFYQRADTELNFSGCNASNLCSGYTWFESRSEYMLSCLTSVSPCEYRGAALKQATISCFQIPTHSLFVIVFPSRLVL